MNHPNRSKFSIARENTGHGHSYVIAHRGATIGHLDIHASGYHDWVFSLDAGPIPSRSTQSRLLKIIRAKG